MNRATLIGRLTRDSEIKEIGQNKICTFTLAMTRQFANSEGVREADYVDCVAFNKTGEIISKYTEKGSQIGITGRIQTGKYEKEGRTYKTFQVVVDEIQLLDSKKEGSTATTTAKVNNTPAQSTSESDPFKEFADEVELTDADLPF